MNTLMFFSIFIAYTIKGLCGFANTLVYSSIMSFTSNNIDITPLELIVGYPSNIIMIVKNKSKISLKTCAGLSAIVIAGSVPGILFLKLGNVQSIKILFGFVIVLVALEMLLREYQKEKIKQNKVVLTIIGILSGVLCGLFGIGALLAAYVSRTSKSTDEFKGNLCAVFLVENTFRIIVYSVLGIINMTIVKNAVFLLPFMIIGLFTGIKLSNIIDEKIVKKFVIIMLIFSGVSLILSNLG